MRDSMGTLQRRSRGRRMLWPLIAVISIVTVGSFAYTHVSAAMQAGRAAAPTGKILPGMASASGTVTSSTAFKAGQVYFRHPEKRITYMVYTNGGKYRVVNLFPGEYEVAARAKGLESDMQRVTVKAGEAPTVNITLREEAQGEGQSYIRTHWGGPGRGTYVSYKELYPPGPGLDILERACMRCHGENFFASPGSEDWWRGRIERRMMGLDVLLGKRPALAYAEGLLNFRNTAMRFGRHDKEVLIDYLVKNFGPDAPRRQVKTTIETPLDEEALGKAQYIEYTLAPDPPGQGVNAPEYKQVGFHVGKRTLQEVRFDAEGAVWAVDRNYPARLSKLDPMTGTWKDYPVPDPFAELHDFIISRDGIIWMAQHGGAIRYGPNGTSVKSPCKGDACIQPQKLWGFNPRTEKYDYDINMDPNNVIRFEVKWMQSLAEDSKGNIIAGWFLGGALSIFHRAENRVTVHPMPYPNAMNYGVVIGKDDWVYATDYGGKIAALYVPTATEDAVGEWREYTPKRYPGDTHRANIDYQGNVVYGQYSGGPRQPGIIGQFDPKIGLHTEWRAPEQYFQPYDNAPDPDGNRIWIADSPTSDRNANIAVLDRKTGRFTFYPKPQFDADSAKIQVTRDSAVWYTPRGSRRNTGAGALFPDKDKIRTLNAFYVNGPPGYPFRVGSEGNSR